MHLKEASETFLLLMNSSVDLVLVDRVVVSLLYRIEDIGCRIEDLELRDTDEGFCCSCFLSDSGHFSSS